MILTIYRLLIIFIFFLLFVNKSVTQDVLNDKNYIKTTNDEKLKSLVVNWNYLNDSSKKVWIENWIKFKVINYKKNIKNKNKSNEKIPLIKNEHTAISIAEILWLEFFGNKIDIAKPFNAILLDNKVWLVFGTPLPGVTGGVPNLAIRKSDGKILDIYMDK